MKLVRLEIRNFRRISYADIDFASSTFIIGQNNCGKSSVISAIEILLSLKDSVTTEDFRETENNQRTSYFDLIGYFSDISAETANSRGFRGRIINGIFTYKKTFHIEDLNKPRYESLVTPYEVKSEYKGCKTIDELLKAGMNENVVDEVYTKRSKKLPEGWEKSFPEVLDFLDGDPIWEENPGGFPSNVNSKLPKLIHIPSLTLLNQIQCSDKSSDKKSILGECLSILGSS